jgi:oligoribonuclease NrnB/cAMP/cGMP phosphodiesterase (DHH superfamily)
MNKIYDFVFFHYPCQDGLASAWIVDLYHRKNNFDIILRPIIHTSKIDIEELQDKRVLFCDISPSIDILEQIEKVAKEIKILDHHISAQRILENKDYAIFDMTKSGCGIAWSFFFSENMPLFIEMIQDRDIWKWQIKDSKDFTTGFLSITSLTSDFYDLFLLFDELYSKSNINYYTEIGKIINKINSNKIKLIAESHSKRIDNYRLSVNENYKVCIVNCEKELTSELRNVLSSMNNIDFAVLWQYDHPKSEYYISLRSNNKVDVSLITSKFGGGGHKNAGGFSSKISPMNIFCK